MKRSMIALLLSICLLASFAACAGSPAKNETTTVNTTDNTSHDTPITVTMMVTLPDGTENTHTLTSTKPTLGDVLRDYQLIECDKTGMIVSVEGVEASWAKDQAYWSFEIDGVYATHGVDDEPFSYGKIYALKYTKG